MSTRLDLVGYDRDDQLALVVEVKKKQDASLDWATQLRRNILAHGTFPNAPFFLLALPDRFYLWKNGVKNQETGDPTYAIDAKPMLKPYLERAGVDAEQISSQSLEFIIAAWLSELAYKKPNELDFSERWLVESGLYDALAGGHLEYEVLA
jgi:hypothetical protein